MALDLDGRKPRNLEQDLPPLPDIVEEILYHQDVTCFLCGFVSGQVVGPPSTPVAARAFVPTTGVEPPPGFSLTRPRCMRCGGGCFLDMVETRMRPSPAAFEKPRRGRKPKPRPA